MRHELDFRGESGLLRHNADYK